ncbi:MAG TPA: gamma-glutamylcyclotransferase family protein [Tepidisphaeraceae bacterium]|nr:gamma-glutamylcyclotransferase family protein [Tepidisphaeraceae bacterium]
MTDLLFAYGTLIPGCEPAAMRAICSRFQLIGEGSVPGTLYDLGSFPGVVEGEGVVRGVVLRVPPDEWPAMDAYEGCPIPGGDDGLFRRVMSSATLDTGEQLDCWLYVYALDVRDHRMVESGDWRRRDIL